MTDITLLLAGLFCFGMTILGVTLTAIEFNKQTKEAARTAAATKHESAKVYEFRQARAAA